MSYGQAYWDKVGQRHHAKAAARSAAQGVEKRLSDDIQRIQQVVDTEVIRLDALHVVLTARGKHERRGRHERG